MQWHPIFAEFLRPLVESHYEVKTDVPVGDAPRRADIVLLHRTSEAPPFQGLWRWLTAWSVLEFKGPTATARVTHLDALLELGLGIRRHLNEERIKQHEPVVDREQVSFWYLASHLGRRFLRDARDLLGELTLLGPGLRRVDVLHHPILLVSARELPVEPDSVPLHLLAHETGQTRLAVSAVVTDNKRLWALYGGLLATFLPEVYKEVEQMARKKKMLDVLGLRPIFKSLPRQEAITEILKELDAKEVVVAGLAKLTPEERAEILRQFQQPPPEPKQIP